jgi:hypothetical protein
MSMKTALLKQKQIMKSAITKFEPLNIYSYITQFKELRSHLYTYIPSDNEVYNTIFATHSLYNSIQFIYLRA